jgi:hypothetical protein
MQRGSDRWNVAVLASVVVPKEPYCVRNTEVVVEETGKEGICLIIVEGDLTGPVYVVFGEPEEVMVLQVYACTDEVRQEWVAIV